MISRRLAASTVQGKIEQQIEAYTRYGENVAQILTQKCAADQGREKQ